MIRLQDLRLVQDGYTEAAGELYAAIVEMRLPLGQEKYKRLNLAINAFYIQADRHQSAEMPETNEC